MPTGKAIISRLVIFNENCFPYTAQNNNLAKLEAMTYKMVLLIFNKEPITP